MKIRIQSAFPLPAAVVWKGLLSPAALDESGRPFLRLQKKDPWPTAWAKGPTYHFGVRLFGLPFAADHRLRFLELDEKRLSWRTDESSDRIRVWNHALILRPVSSQSCWVEEELELEAGVWTPVYACLASLLYRYRRRRLARALAHSSFS